MQLTRCGEVSVAPLHDHIPALRRVSEDFRSPPEDYRSPPETLRRTTYRQAPLGSLADWARPCGATRQAPLGLPADRASQHSRPQARVAIIGTDGSSPCGTRPGHTPSSAGDGPADDCRPARARTRAAPPGTRAPTSDAPRLAAAPCRPAGATTRPSQVNLPPSDQDHLLGHPRGILAPLRVRRRVRPDQPRMLRQSVER